MVAKKRMNILYDYQVFVHNTRGGTSRYFAELIHRISNNPAVQTTVFVGLHINNFVQPYFTNHQSVIGLGPFPKKGSRLLKPIDRLLFEVYSRRTENHFDVYHPTYYYIHSIPLKRCKRVITVHDMVPERYPQYISPQDKTHFNKRVAAEQADAIIAVSRSTKRDINEFYGIAEDKIQVIYHGNSMAVHRELQSAYHSIPSDPYLLYVGRRGGYKNFERLLLAFLTDQRLHTDFLLLCFGGGKLTSREREIIHQYDADQRVMWLQGTDAVLQQAYSHAQALVFPSLYEGFGLPLVEAMGLGCPVIAGKSAAVVEVLEGAGYLFEPDRVEAIQNALHMVLYDEEQKYKLIERGFKRAQHFSWEECESRTIELYQSLL